MNTKGNLLEECLKNSRQYAKLMSQYKHFFNCLFANPLQAFGYERWTMDDRYFGLSAPEQQALELFLKEPRGSSPDAAVLKSVFRKLESLKNHERFRDEYHELQSLGLLK